MDEKKIKQREELFIIRAFMKQKKITLTDLSKEMSYSIRHIIRVFNKKDCDISPRFMKELFHGLEVILQKDLKEFYNLLRGTSWTALVWDSIPSSFVFN